MILTIAANYRQAKALGGDSELLMANIGSAEAYVNGPLKSMLFRLGSQPPDQA